MKLLSSRQLQEVEDQAIGENPSAATRLIEQAAGKFVEVLVEKIPIQDAAIAILCGPGNNGADGLAIARLLCDSGYRYKQVAVYQIAFSANTNNNHKVNLARLPKGVKSFSISAPAQLRSLKCDVLIDAVLGSGLNRPLSGPYAEMAAIVNALHKKVIAVDIPTGLPAEGVIENYNGIEAGLTITFSRPKINFFFPESALALRHFIVRSIGLADDIIEAQSSPWQLTDEKVVRQLLKPRPRFSHKGTFGHVLLFAGNTATMGAALLSAGACLHAGAGLITVAIPQSGLTALNTTLPEAMFLARNEVLPGELFTKFNALAIGPGLGTEAANETLLSNLINLNRPLLLDADALTILSRRPDLRDKLAGQSIITPHVKEFDRIFGEHKNWWERVETARKQAKRRNWIIVLKNQYTFVCLPDNAVHINGSGNPAMASGGMGDVLTGIIAALLAQGYEPTAAAITGTYLHGKAGDELAGNHYCISASQLAKQVPKTIKQLLEVE